MRLDAATVRLRYFLTVRPKKTFLALVLVGLVLAGAGAATYEVPKETVEERKHPLTVSTSLDTSTVATGNSSLYPRGTELKNLPVYLTSVSSNLSLSLETKVEAPTEASVEQRLLLVHRLSHSGDVFWNSSDVIGVSRESFVDGEGVVRTRGRLDINEIKDEVSRLRSEVGAGAKLSSLIVTEAEYETDRYEGKVHEGSGLRISDTSYSVEDDINATESRTTTVSREVVDESRVVRFAGATLPFISLALVGAGVLAVVFGVLSLVYVRFAPSAETLRHELERSRYSEWISEGEVPWGKSDRSVRMGSLRDLVDVGIDASKRTLYDPDRETYAVLDGDTVYYHRKDLSGDDEG